MLTDTIEISGLPEAVIQGVSDRAKAVGTTAEEYVRYLIEEDLSSSSLNRSRQRTNKRKQHV